jgi:hypothetical protein
MHTYSLLTEHADRSTIAAKDLPLLDRFLEHLQTTRKQLRAAIDEDTNLAPEEKSEEMIQEHFHLLQACDNLSLLSCVAYEKPANLLHPLPLKGGSSTEVKVIPVGPRRFQLAPWPFFEPELTFQLPARHVDGKTFASSEELTAAFDNADEKHFPVTLIQ